MKNKISKKIRHRIMLILILILIGFSVVVGSFYLSFCKLFQKDIENISEVSSQNIYAQTNNLIDIPLNVSITMSKDTFLRDFMVNELEAGDAGIDKVKEYLSKYQEEYHFDSVFLVSTKTNNYYHYKNGLDRVLEKGNEENTWYYDFISGSDEYSLNVDNDEADHDNMTLFVNCKVRDENKQVIGVVGIGLAVPNIQEFIDNSQKEYNVSAYFLDSDGNILISKDYTKFDHVNIFENKNLTGITKAFTTRDTDSSTSMWYHSKHFDSFIVTKYIPNLHWYLVIEKNTKHFMSIMTQQIAITILLSLFVIVLVSITISRLLVKQSEDVLRLEASQQKELQKALTKAQEANRVKTDFLARVSHDMRTPMNGIIGLTQILIEDYNLESEVTEDLKQIQYSSEYLLSLINDTLDLSCMESHNLKLKMEDVLPQKLIENVLTIVRLNAKKKNITVDFIDHVKTFKVVHMDSVRQQQIWLNILSNAIKFTPQDGLIEVELEEVSHNNQSSVIKTTFRDNGIGISLDFLPHVFEPFAQEHSETTNQYGGTGLGMSIVKRLVEMMDGTITVESKQKEGTTFTVMMTYYWSSNQESKENVSEVPVDLNGVRVLLCEDHPLNQKVACRILEKEGMIVEKANDGLEGVEKFKYSSDGYYDVIIMDIRMPVMDGLDATRNIRALSKADAKTVPIIAMTANAFEEDIQNSYDAGMNEHLAKPINPQEVYLAIAKYVKK